MSLTPCHWLSAIWATRQRSLVLPVRRGRWRISCSEGEGSKNIRKPMRSFTPIRNCSACCLQKGRRRLADARGQVPARVGLQGALDQFFLGTAAPVVAAETNRVLEEMRGRHGYIFNLGHGVPPNAKLENIAALVDIGRAWK